MGIKVREKAFQVRPYGVIAFTPSTPAMAVATVTMTFRMVFRVSLLIFMMFVFLVLPSLVPTGRERGRPAGVAVPDLRAFGQACRSLAAAGTRDGKMVNKKNTCVFCVCVCRRLTTRGPRRSRDIAWPTRQAPPCRCRRGRG